ncbi:MAG: hypothetical protein R2788_18620 [Saprospiraceae bacterium]
MAKAMGRSILFQPDYLFKTNALSEIGHDQKLKDDLRLYINRIIQFSALDEYRYHESLALVALNAAPSKKNVLILRRRRLLARKSFATRK